MRAPFQVLVIPYRLIQSEPQFCIFRRADQNQYQFIAGGGEDNETPIQAAKREAFEEGGIRSDNWLTLESLSSVPIDCIAEEHRIHWDKNTFVIPEYCFAVKVSDEISISREHTQYEWLDYSDARKKLEWDSNRTALYELKRCLSNN